MNRYVKSFFALCTVLIMGAVLFQGCSQVKKTPLPFQTSYAPIITEISPQSTDKEKPWIELTNPLKQEVDASRLKLVINDEYTFSIPDKLSKMPPMSRILIKLDNENQTASSYEFKEKSTPVLHPGPTFAKAVQTRAGQIAVYQKNINGKDVLVDFVAWGKPASKKSLSVERNRIWRKNWFVPQVNSFGDYEEKMLSQVKDFSIARYPGSQGQHRSDWVVLQGNQRTPGAANLIPGVGMFTINNDATIRSEDIKFGWTSNKFAKKFIVQLAKDNAFQQMVEQKEVEAGHFKPAAVLPEGKYYYRVKVIDKQKRESAWSKTRTLNSKKFRGSQDGGAGDDGAITAEKVLNAMQFKFQKKDTNLLCLDGCPSHLDGATVKHWDKVHPEAGVVVGDHGDWNCVRASISMMVSFYGKTLSQDRISYRTEEGAPGAGDGLPEGDMSHSIGMSYTNGEETDTLEWALDETINDFYHSPDPTFNELKGFIDADRPIMTRRPGHLRAMNGYREEDDGTQWVHVMDPWDGERWETYPTWQAGAEPAEGTWIGPATAPNAREDEPEIWTDADNDGVMDFDEMIRFGTGRFDVDSDNDGVNDKEDIYEYVYQWGDVYAKRGADFDVDGVRKEADPDNDGDTFSDGCEDQNSNGIFEAASGETDNFAANVGLVCAEQPIHAMVIFDRSGSMKYPIADSKYDIATDAATLFLDTWLVNNPPALTKTGLVYYDESAYYDTDVAENTTLELLNAAKRDKIVASFATNNPDTGSTSIGGGILKAMEAQGFNTAGVAADAQHRVMIVLTDGKENAGTRMDNPLVTQALVDGKVDGYVLGIGDETQIDEVKLNNLADILNHSPASLAKDITQFQVEKFFLQVLAETQGMEFNLDPVSEMSPGQTKTHTVSVSPGTERVTFVVVWKEQNAKIEFTLKNQNGQTVAADKTKSHVKYQVSAKDNPAAGNWSMVLTGSATGTPAPAKIHYSVMALEKNASVASNFQILGGYYLAGNQLKLIADLSKDKKSLKKARVQVEINRPTVGWGTFASDANVSLPSNLAMMEKDVVLSGAEKKFQAMAAQKMSVPTTKATITLNDEGEDGDDIPGDGRYTGTFTKTKLDGVYAFRFMAKSGHINREKFMTLHLKPRILSSKSILVVKQRDYQRVNKLTTLKLTITPKDRFGNKIGPGCADMLQLDTKQGKIVNVVDKLDGSYEVQMTAPGDYKANPVLKPEFQRLNVKKR